MPCEDKCDQPTSKMVPLHNMRPVILARRADLTDAEFKAADTYFDVVHHRTDITPHRSVIARHVRNLGDYHDLCVDVRNLRGRMLNNSIMHDWLGQHIKPELEVQSAIQMISLEKAIELNTNKEELVTKAVVYCAYGEPIAASDPKLVLYPGVFDAAKYIAQRHANFFGMHYMKSSSSWPNWVLFDVFDPQDSVINDLDMSTFYGLLAKAILERDKQKCSVGT
jgi:hypothetical protein